jgi:PKD repeat protein
MVMSDLLTVSDIPEANFATNQSGTVVTFEDLSSDADQLLWVFGDGTTSEEQNPIHDYGAFGSYDVMLIATNECGADTNFLQLELQGLPVPDFTVSAQSGCVPLEITFEDLSQNMPDTWEWSFPGGSPSTSNEQNPTVTYNSPGVYDVSLTASNSTGSETIMRTGYILASDEPIAGFEVETASDVASFTNMSEGANNYFWDFGDGATSQLPEPEHVYPGSGTYLVTLIATNSCGSDTSQFEVVIETTLYQYPELGAHLEIWPNPNNGQFLLDISAFTGELQIEVFDIQGKRHFTNMVSAPVRTDISLHNAAPGMYIVILSNSNGRSLQKVIVE